MGASCLRQFLQSLCQNSIWNYAVFWKLQHENQMLLTWEDGCCGHQTLKESAESGLDETCIIGSNAIFSSSWRQVVLCLAGVHYQWGEGVVGEVAYTGKHYWLSCEDVSAGEFESEVVPQCPGEWLLQFEAGIKTIVLVPVVPHGVLQLGALEKVDEDAALVAYVRDKFNAYQNDIELLPFSSMEFLAQTSSSVMPSIMYSVDDLSTIIVNQMKSEDPEAVHGVKPTNELSITNQMPPVCQFPNASYLSGKCIGDICNSRMESETSFQSISLMEESNTLGSSLNDRVSEMMEDNIFGHSSVEEELQAFSYSDNYNLGIFGEHVNMTMNFYSNGCMTEQSVVDNNADFEGHKNTDTSLQFPMDSELHKALGPAFQGQTKGYMLDRDAHDDAYDSSSKMNRGHIHGVRPSPWASNECFAQKFDTGHLLEAVVDSMNTGLNDDLYNKADDIKLSTVSSGQFALPTKAEGISEESEVVEEKKVLWSSVSTAFDAWDRNFVSKSLPAPSLESVVCAMIKEQQQNKGHGCQQARKGSRVSSASKRKARPGENQRPRPRDRQLIQDRVKELRELVPNGSKCSIDGLLDRTIKHMMFLRSVTDQADKLKQWVHQEVTVREKMKPSDTCGTQNGTSWAFELGSDLQVCPIIVEDLEYPGHMIIEMLCNDHGLFLEIAEVIRRLELTILKGVMESRTDNSWAHFIVQASKGFHRLDIFWPLLRLLQQNRSSIPTRI